MCKTQKMTQKTEPRNLRTKH